MEGRQKTKKALPLKKRQPLRENKGCTTLFPMWFQISAILRPCDLREPEHVCLRPLTAEQPLHPGPQCTRKPASLCC